jgi:drug/metabolite transporter (DMT)-like permease
MATASFFTSFIEPMLLRYRVRTYELLLGLAIIPGMALVVKAAPTEHLWGIIVGLISAALAALFGAMNKKYISDHNPFQVTLLEIGSASIFITLVLAGMAIGSVLPDMRPSPTDWLYLGILSLLCTTLAYVLSLRALRYISAFATALTINLEPVYGIILAWIILREDQELDIAFYIGVLIILAAVMSYPIVYRKFYKNRVKP